MAKLLLAGDHLHGSYYDGDGDNDNDGDVGDSGDIGDVGDAGDVDDDFCVVW